MESLFLNELSKCVRCAGCKALCPTYEEDSTESMGARGRIALLGALSSGKSKPSAILNDRIFSCTLCGTCAGLCPPGVDIKEVIYHGRDFLKKTDKKRKYLRFFTNFYTKRPQLSFKLLSLTQHFLFPAVVFRLVPAVRLTRAQTHDLKQQGVGAATPRMTLGRALVAVQVAITVPLLVCAVLFLRTVANLGAVDVGFDPAGITYFKVNPAGIEPDPAAQSAVYLRVLEAVRRIPGVTSATLVENALLSGNTSNTRVRIGDTQHECT